jgi:hypothetical protein
VREQERRRSPASNKKSQPSVGIIFLLPPHRLQIESTPIAEAEVYGDFLNHARGHEQFWAQLQAEGQVPRDQDYFEFPRGRAVVNRLTGHPTLYIDKCIIKRPALVREIKRRLQLPARVEILTDPHYRCPVCLSRSSL